MLLVIPRLRRAYYGLLAAVLVLATVAHPRLALG